MGKLIPLAPAVSAAEIGGHYGSRATLLQFSSAFCTPCRATRTLLGDITADMSDVLHLDLDAESHLELVRRLNIISTPTTLILNHQGVEVGRAVGAPKRTQVIAALAAISAQKNESGLPWLIAARSILSHRSSVCHAW